MVMERALTFHTSKILTMASTEANELKAQGNEAFRKVSGYTIYIVRQNKQ